MKILENKHLNKVSELSIIFLVIMIPVIFFTRANDVFEINKMFTLRFMSIMVCGLWLASAVMNGRLVLTKTAFDFPVLGFLAVSFLTTVITSNYSVSVWGVYEDFEGILTVLNYTVLYYIIVNFGDRMHSIKKITLGVLIAAFLIAVYGLAQNFGIDFVRWNPETYNPGRFFSTLGNPNFLAAYLVEAIPLIFILFFNARRTAPKLAVFSVLLAAIIVLFLTKSRAGFLSFMVTVVVIAVYTVIDARKKENELFEKNKGWFMLFGAILLATMFVPKVQEAFKMVWERVLVAVSPESFKLTPRLYIWKSALMMFLDNPVLGKGLDTFQVIFPYYRLPIYWQLEWNGTPEKAHNVFLQVLSTQGIAGFGFYALLVFSYFKKSLNLVFQERDFTRRYLIFGILMSMIAYFTQGFFNYTVVAYGSFFWIALGMIIILDGEKRKKLYYEFDTPAGKALLNNRKAVIFALAALVLVLQVLVTRYWAADMYFKIGNIGVASDKETLALPYYRQAVEMAPPREIYWVKYGIAFERAMRKETDPARRMEYVNSAIEVHKRTIEMNPMNGYNFNNLARVYKYYGEAIDPSKYQDAINYYKEAIKRDPNNAYFGLDLATVYINMQQWEKAAELCDRYISIYPDFATPYSYKGYIYMLMGQKFAAKSREYYEQAVSGKQWFRDAVSESSTYSNLGILYVNMNMPDKAIEAFNNVVRVRPDYVEGYLNLGRLYTLIKDKQKAAEMYETALRFSPNDQRAVQALDDLRRSR